MEESELRERDEARLLARQLEQGAQLMEESGIGAVSFVSCAIGHEAVKLDEDESKY